MQCIMWIDLLILEKLLHLWDKPHLVMVNDFFNVLLKLDCWYFVDDFYIYGHQGYWSVILFYIWFWYRGDGGLIEWVCRFFFLWNFFLWGGHLGEQFQKDRYKSISKSLKNSPVKPSGPKLLFFGSFKITVLNLVLVIVLFIFSVYSWFSFVRLYLKGKRTCPFLPNCHFIGHFIGSQ